jgi:hypothetical protein
MPRGPARNRSHPKCGSACCRQPATSSIVRTVVEAHHVARECCVFTTDEVAILIDAVGDCVLDLKHKFPGATVTGIRRKAPVDWERGDEFPF